MRRVPQPDDRLRARLLHLRALLVRSVVVHEGHEHVHHDVPLPGFSDLLLAGYNLTRDAEFLPAGLVELDDEVWFLDARTREGVRC